ncbi:hypothetical protein KC343_g23191, partial [Hortaea werneckii]
GCSAQQQFASFHIPKAIKLVKSLVASAKCWFERSRLISEFQSILVTTELHENLKRRSSLRQESLPQLQQAVAGINGSRPIAVHLILQLCDSSSGVFFPDIQGALTFQESARAACD